MSVVVGAGCGGFGAVRTVGGKTVGVEAHSVGLARFVSFVNVKESIVRADAGADFAMLLPGGDWLAKVNAGIVRLSPDGRTVRWTATGIAPWDMVLATDGRVICAGELADPAALNGAARSVFALDTERGTILWRSTADPIVRGARATLARVGSVTVAVSAYGETGIDDTGAVVWFHSDREPSDERLVVPARGGVVVVSTPEPRSSDPVGVPLHRPVLVRSLAIATGEERGRATLAAEGDFYALGELGFSADGRVAIQASDVRVVEEPWTSPEGERSTIRRNEASARLLEIDARDLAAPVVRARALPAEQPSAMPRQLARSEVVFVDRYATDGAWLGMQIVDLASGRVRRVPLLHTGARHSYIQLTQLGSRAGQITFAGQFSGKASPLRARVEVVDWCEAQGGIECFGEHDDVTLAPTAAVIGAVSLPVAP